MSVPPAFVDDLERVYHDIWKQECHKVESCRHESLEDDNVEEDSEAISLCQVQAIHDLPPH